MNVTAWTVQTLAVPASGGEGEGFAPPNPADFYQPLWNIAGFEFTRPMLLISIAAVVLIVWRLATTSKAKVVPSKGQWLTEQVYDFVRNGL